MIRILSLFVFFAFTVSATAQTTKWEYQDTLHFVFNDQDSSIYMDLGDIDLDCFERMPQLTVYFTCEIIKGRKVIIDRAFTSDPHYICKWPSREPWAENKLYEFTICFTGRPGPLNKTMGFQYTTSSEERKRIYLRLKGYFKE